MNTSVINSNSSQINNMKRSSKANTAEKIYSLDKKRLRFLIGIFGVCFATLVVRASWLQIWNNDFFQSKGEQRYAKMIDINAPRGKIFDRNGQVLASNIPAYSIWAIPEDAQNLTNEQIDQLHALLGDVPKEKIIEQIGKDQKRFVYLKRLLDSDRSNQIKALNLPGIHTQLEVKRDYPQGDVFGHLTGFTNMEGKGLEGLELVFDKQIHGEPGLRRVIRNRNGQVIEDAGVVQTAQPGLDVQLSLDARVQYITHSAIKDAVVKHKAKSASAIVVDTHTGEVLALANYPSYDPNQRGNYSSDVLRNRAVTDLFEPGSTFKPFTIAMALDRNLVTPKSMISTNGGRLEISGAKIGDSHAEGDLTVQQVIQKSSNVGTAKIALKMKPTDMYSTYKKLGFTSKYELGFPGIVNGIVRAPQKWQPIEQATMSYGHGIAVSLLHLTQAYTSFAREGEIIPLTLLKQDKDIKVKGEKVFSKETSKEMLTMLNMATEPGGTAPMAQVIGYTVGGKTGTAYKVEGNTYNKNKYVASFAGLAPITSPRIVVTVMVDEPTANGHFGGQVAAPVFSKIVSETLRTLSVTPDAPYKTTINNEGTREVF